MPEEPKPKRSFASAAEFGAKYARIRARLKAEKAARVALEKERDDLKAKPAPEDVVKERDALKGQIRSGKHRAAFDAAAKAARVKPEALDDLWELSKLDTSADEPDAKAIGASIAEKTKLRPYLLDAEGSTTPAESPAPLTPGPGSERGGRAQSAGMTITSAQLCDGDFMQANQDRITEAQSQGLLTVVA